ncbi:hypothetical protein MGN01_04380 [Methylobacterium gnaphalii]|uniref:Uncharacterized protein n=1 Tax=Methylobacterium gnaphalii TaxID=1010610 RepID=A0A512JF78_9HYPH|nr:hypothetical protein MGN01_04380 [Methylobacterium gnaphalii]GLS50810.1 hypothetical protein GCM10007885_36640 [Methylobacterium gnaphalii]
MPLAPLEAGEPPVVPFIPVPAPLLLPVARPLPGTLPGSEVEDFVVEPPVTLPPDPLPPGAPWAQAALVRARASEAAAAMVVIRMVRFS